MKMYLSQGSWLAFIVLVTFLWSGGTATEVSGKEFPWPIFRAALIPPRDLGSGYIALRLKNDVVPHFDESASAACELKTHTVLTCGLATLRYDAIEDDGQLRIRRNGSIRFMPVGTCTQTECVVYHQASVEETITWWVWMDTYWKLVAQQSVSDDWDDILRFDLQEATHPGGTTVGVTTSTGSALWTFELGAIM